MSEHVKLEASDGHELDAYVAHPEGGPIAGLVVVQEIFGVNRHIRCILENWINIFRRRASTRWRRRIPRCRSSGTTRATASTATIGRATTRKRRSWRRNARWSF